ncbi:hypothetical protein SAMN02745206_02520 [Desulfacinum infernum DSM 9756]|uniref:Uncharacterized protein n=1 Tax=Desulfacinum infernum DSM 9756 TaxID=1121391 RepID=A0A1M5DWJ6_9BACT|nr:hypothetical protein [Desulfacinum infernum]SHF71329.1 hypothetical protein SAMN02745206_02520 [Desulfacinum infernum DSM 9756]
MKDEEKKEELLPLHGCTPPVDSDGHPYTCEERKTVLTVKEQKVLQRILAVKEEASQLKTRLKELSPDVQEHEELRAQLEKRLEELKAFRRELEKEREKAAQERMELLGHV